MSKKRYEVWGIAMVPNEIIIHVDAESEKDALREAERVFYASDNRKQYVQSLSTDEAGVDQFVASEATEVSEDEVQFSD